MIIIVLMSILCVPRTFCLRKSGASIVRGEIQRLPSKVLTNIRWIMRELDGWIVRKRICCVPVGSFLRIGSSVVRSPLSVITYRIHSVSWRGPIIAASRNSSVISAHLTLIATISPITSTSVRVMALRRLGICRVALRSLRRRWWKSELLAAHIRIEFTSFCALCILQNTDSITTPSESLILLFLTAIAHSCSEETNIEQRRLTCWLRLRHSSPLQLLCK